MPKASKPTKTRKTTAGAASGSSSGSGSGSRKRAAAPVDDGMAMAQMPLGKQLAHTDKKVRDQAIRNLEAFLSQSDGEDGAYAPLPEKEMSKLWKGLFYCFWMSDKPLVQQGLATDLANMVLRINPVGASTSGAQLSAALAFLEGFWVALVREWNGIDRLRMDKFYMLIRRYVNATFRLLAREGWSSEAVEGVNAILGAQRGPMTWQDKSVPTSLATHLADVYLDELDKVLGEDMGNAPLAEVLAPHITLLARTPSKAVHDRLTTVLFHPLLAALAESDDDEEGRPTKRRKAAPSTSATGEFDNIVAHAAGATVSKKAARAALLKAMFKAAAADGAVEANRRKIYAVVRAEDEDEDDE